MNRFEKILYRVDKTKPGVEVGPSHNPAAPKKDGYNVHIIDHLSTEGLLEKYKGHKVRHDRIETVDFVWKGESYSDLTRQTSYYSWVIAAHVIEHTPDLISFLQQCQEILNDDGILSLAVPDKRYCFDYYRQCSSVGDVIDAHLEKRVRHTPGNIYDYFINTVRKNGRISWGKKHEGDFELMHSRAEAKGYSRLARESGHYFDVHAWCFTPSSFRLILHDLNILKYIDLKEDVFFDSIAGEFFITLSKKGKGLTIPRMDMLKKIDAELKAV